MPRRIGANNWERNVHNDFGHIQRADDHVQCRFLVGNDASLLIEGFVTANGAAFQMETRRKVSRGQAAGAIDTHYHFDHSCGNSFYGANNIQLGGHAEVAKRIMESYRPTPRMPNTAVLARRRH
jgi:glyoxylase-like metal-dependent hydrolase (beta-lactamase superfamily II)